MTKKKITMTHVLMLADMSGSMHGLESDVRGGFNAYVRDLQKRTEDIRLTMVVFDTVVEPICLDTPLERVPELTVDNYAPRGCTALLDAVGETITGFQSRVKLRKTERVLVVIQTDGFENSSREWTFTKIRTLIEGCEATSQWGFIYLGAGTDSWAQAKAMGMSRLNYIHTPATSTGTQSVYEAFTTGTVAYAAGANTTTTADVIRNTPGVEVTSSNK